MAKKSFQKIYIEITNQCNLHCSFCPETKRAPKRLSLGEFEYILDQAVLYTDYICLHIKGEPLTHPELEEMLKAAQKRKLKVNLTTNATLLERRKDILLSEAAPRQISLSLHSFDANDLKPSDFDQYIDTAISFAKEFTASTEGYISFRLWNLENDASLDQYERNHLILKKLEEAYSLDRLESHTDKFKGNALAKNTYLNFDHLFEWPDLSSPYYSCDGSCYGLRSQLGILSDGRVVPCCLDGEGILTLGNIFEEKLSDILTKEKSLRIAEGFRNQKIHEEFCRHCGYRSRF